MPQSASSDVADMQPSVDADGAAVAVLLPATLHVSAAASSSRISGVMGLDQKVSFILFFFPRYAMADLNVRVSCLGEQYCLFLKLAGSSFLLASTVVLNTALHVASLCFMHIAA